jgi:hypothetical protein
MPTDSGVECEWCNQLAIGEVHGQWSIFDFLRYYVCETHIDQAETKMLGITFDGQEVIDVWFERYWRESDEHWVM